MFNLDEVNKQTNHAIENKEISSSILLKNLKRFGWWASTRFVNTLRSIRVPLNECK